MRIDSTVLLTVSQRNEQQFVGALIGQEYANDCYEVAAADAEHQAHEKLELARAMHPRALAIGMLFSGYGLDPTHIMVPQFGIYVVLLDLEGGDSATGAAFQRNVPGWTPCQLDVHADLATQIAIDDVLGAHTGDQRRSKLVLLQKLQCLRAHLESGGSPAELAVAKYSRLHKLAMFNPAEEQDAVDSDVCYELLARLVTNRKWTGRSPQF